MAFLSASLPGLRGGGAAVRRVAALIGLVLLASMSSPARAQTPTSEEHQLKAVYLFNFAQFVEWPARAFRDPQAPFIIGVLGEDPFGAYLDEVVRGEKVGGRPFIVRRYKRVEDIAECHILFISRSETDALAKIIPPLKGRSILTVGEADTFTRGGGMIRFVLEDGKVRMRINVEAAKACDLKISSKIISGRVVTADKE